MTQLWDAWARWWAGEQVGGLPLFGTTVLFWGRLGKVLQFAAGLVVVLDLVGTHRLTATRDRLRGGLDRASKLIARFTWTRWWIAENRGPWRRWLGMLSYYVIYGLIVWVSLRYGDAAEKVVKYPITALFAVVFFVVTTIALAAQLLLAVGYGVSSLALWLFGGEQPGHVARWLALGLFVVGFQFDLLAS